MARKSIQLATIVALLSLGGFGLTSCAPGESSPIESRASIAEPVVEDAAGFVDKYRESAAKQAEVDASKPPAELTKEQSAQLLAEGKIDGMSQEDVKNFVDSVYASTPGGNLVYFHEGASESKRMKAALMISLTRNLTSDTIDPTRMTVDESSGTPKATVMDGSAPPLIFVDNNWWIDGEALLAQFNPTPAG